MVRFSDQVYYFYSKFSFYKKYLIPPEWGKSLMKMSNFQAVTNTDAITIISCHSRNIIHFLGKSLHSEFSFTTFLVSYSI